MKLTEFDIVILVAAFLTMVFSFIMWILDAESLTAAFIGIWVPSILGLGIFLKMINILEKIKK